MAQNFKFIQFIEVSNLENTLKKELLSVAECTAGLDLFIANVLQNSSFTTYDLNVRVVAVLSLLGSISVIRNGDFSQIISFLKNSITDPDREFGKIILPLLPDVRDVLQKNNAPNEAWTALVEFENKLFPYLPKKELESIVATQLLPFMRAGEFLPEFRQAYLVAEPIYDGGIWCESFLPLLKKNREVLGEKVILDEKDLPPTIVNWLLDFEYFVKKPLEDVQSFDVVIYANNSANSKSLSAEDRKTLLQILEFYIWLQAPFVTREDAVALGLELEGVAKQKAVGGRAVDQVEGEQRADVVFPPVQVVSAPARKTEASQAVSTKRKFAASNSLSADDIARIVNEPELIAGKEVLELAGGNSAPAQQKNNGSSMTDIAPAISDLRQNLKSSTGGSKVASPEDFAARLEEIKRQVLEKRRQDEALKVKGMDGFAKQRNDNGGGVTP